MVALESRRGRLYLLSSGELFTIFEIGFDPQLAPRQPGQPPPGDVHLSVWRQDERKEDTAEAWGFAVSASQRFGRYLPFVRYGYMDIDSDGRLLRRVGSTLTTPTPIEHQVNVGFAYDGVFRQSGDRIGVGATWARPADGSLDNQGALDLFYRIQVTPRIAVPNVIINWEQDSDNRYTVPVGFGINRTFQFGKLPVRIGVEYFHSVVTPDDIVGSDWSVRLYVIPAVPSALFGWMQ